MGIRSSKEDSFYLATETGCMKADDDGNLRPAGAVRRPMGKDAAGNVSGGGR